MEIGEFSVFLLFDSVALSRRWARSGSTSWSRENIAVWVGLCLPPMHAWRPYKA